MDVKVQYILNNNIILKRYLREHSFYYKNILRNPNFINDLVKLMKEEYHLTLPDRLDKIKDNLSFFNTFIDVIK